MDEVAAQRLQTLGKLGALRHIPTALNPIRGRDAQAQHAVIGLAHGGKNFQRKADAVLKTATVFVSARIGQRRQELVQQIAVGAVDFNRVHTDAVRALGCRHEGVANLRQFLQCHGRRRYFAGQIGFGRRRKGFPTALRRRQQLRAVPGQGARCFAPGVRQLHADRQRRRQFARALQSLAHGVRGALVPQTQAIWRNAAFGQHGGGLDREHRGTAVEQITPVHQMPVAGGAVLRLVLAHRRDHDAIGQAQATARRGQGQWGKQQAHESGLGWNGGGKCKHSPRPGWLSDWRR